MIEITLHIFLFLLLLAYIIIEICFISITKMLLIQHLLVNINLRKKIKKSVPPWWKIVKLDTLTS